MNPDRRLRTARPVARLRTGDVGWYKIENRAGSARVILYDEIGYFGVTASDFIRELDALDVRKIDLRVNSPGGDVFDGLAIYNALKNHPAKVTASVDGLAASAASFIIQAADDIVMEQGATVMIHDALSVTIGNAADHRETADLLDKMSDEIAGIYAARSGRSAESFRDLMRSESWFNGDEAVAAGLADRVVTDESDDESGDAGSDDGSTKDTASVSARWDLSVFSYAGRDEAPAPVIVPVEAATPVAAETSAPVPTVPVDLASVIRNAIKEATR
jgi:ATP-dependent protease ClpP protease subunit